MKKSILILLLILVISQLKAMDPLSDDMKKWYEDLGIDIKDLPKVSPDRTAEDISAARWDMVRAAYKKQSLKYHPDRNPGNKAAEEKFKEIGESYKKLEKLLTESKEPTLVERMESARANAELLLKQADDIDQPDAARELYEEAFEPFLREKIVVSVGGKEVAVRPVYGLDILGIASYKALEKYYQKLKYDDVIKYGQSYIRLIDATISAIKNILPVIDQFNLTNQSYVTRMGKPYIAKVAYNEMLENYKRGLNEIMDLARRRKPPVPQRSQIEPQNENLLEALKQLSRSFSDLKGKLTIS